MATLYLPDLRMTIPRFANGTNPDGDQVASSLQDWFARFGKVSPGFSSNRVRSFGLAAIMCFPIADQRQLCATAQWITISFAWDDVLDDPEEDNVRDNANGANEINNMFLSIFDHPEISETQAEMPIVAAFRAFWAGFRATSTSTMQKRFAVTVRDYAQAAKDLVHNREKRRSPSIEEFIAMRRATAAVEVCTACIEYCLGIEVPDEAYYHIAVQKLRLYVNDIVAWTNDLYSFNKEQAVGDYQNLVAVVAIEKHLDVQSAVQFVFTMIQSAIDHFFEIKGRMPGFDPKIDELVARYVRGLECVASGFIHWHMAIDRYFGSKVGKVQDRIPVKVLPREKDALDPGFELNFNTPSTATAPVGNGESTSKDAARAASPGALLQGIYS